MILGKHFSFALLITLFAPIATTLAQNQPKVCEACLRSDVEFLASDALRGRGSATPDELIAATYVASVFHRLGLKPAVDGNYILPVTLSRQKFVEPPQLRFSVNGKETVWTHGKEMVSPRLSQPVLRGKLFHSKAGAGEATKVPEGSIVVISDSIPDGEFRPLLTAFSDSKAAAVIIKTSGPYLKNWDRLASQSPTLPTHIEGEPASPSRIALIAVRPESLTALTDAPDGTEVTISGPVADDNQLTRNVVGILPGSDPKLKNEYVMFSAHMDHLGVCAKTGDTICNGADDDASGTATVLELARIFTTGERPKRSVVFTTYGSEELGLLGSRAFAAKPPMPLGSIIADIEFEQTGLPESRIGGKGFWMTGSQLTDLRSLLSQHGSELSDDPFPGNPFFQASDNYSFAKKGVVAHTISGAAEFPDYHQPGDEANKLNYNFMAQSIQSILPGLEWLLNTDTKPAYKPGKNPAEKR